MKAMVFAAGVGSRLQPITNKIPKALVEVNGKTLLMHTIEYLAKYKVSKIIINIHHFGDQIIEYCNAHDFGVEISFSDERNLLLDTGGGLKKASKLLKGEEPFIVTNADILTDVNIDDMLKDHNENNNMVTLAVRERNSSRKLIFDNNYKLCGWKNTITNEIIEVNSNLDNTFEYPFSGLHIICPSIFTKFPEGKVFSIIEFYLSIAKSCRIGGFIHNNGYWFDVGTIEKLKEVKQFYQKIKES